MKETKNFRNFHEATNYFMLWNDMSFFQHYAHHSSQPSYKVGQIKSINGNEVTFIDNKYCWINEDLSGWYDVTDKVEQCIDEMVSAFEE